MADPARRPVRLRSYAKINLGLEVLALRDDGYHELRTVFQTISLADTIDIEFTPGRRSNVELVSDVDIPDNLVERAARLAMEALRIRGRARFHLAKRILFVQLPFRDQCRTQCIKKSHCSSPFFLLG